MEGRSQVFDQLTEVHTLIGDVVEDGLIAVALILHVTDFHVQSQTFGYLTALDHRTMLTGLCFPTFLQVGLTGNAVDALDVISRFQVGLLHLEVHESACQRHNTYVVTRTSLYSHHVSLFQFEVVHVVVVSFAGVLELYLYEVCGLHVARHVSQPVIGVQLSVLSTYGLMTESSVAAHFHNMFFCLFHIFFIYRMA